jgi:hypothetical protein
MAAVFNVDIGDGEPIRKLPYNRSGTTLISVISSATGSRVNQPVHDMYAWFDMIQLPSVQTL